IATNRPTRDDGSYENVTRLWHRGHPGATVTAVGSTTRANERPPRMAQATIQRGPVSGTAVGQATRRRSPFFLEFYGSAIGKKYVMAVTGIIGMLFVLAHMIGNLKMFLGAAEYNAYAEFLRDLLVPIAPRTVVLWLLRIGLIVALLLHL